jgi:hypothetical protein
MKAAKDARLRIMKKANIWNMIVNRTEYDWEAAV